VTPDVAYPKGGFTPCYVKALSGATLAFGVIHAIQTIAVGMFRNESLSMRADGLFALAFFELIEGSIFFVIGIVMALVPARVADKYISRSSMGAANFFCWLGALAGITYLPLCAGISTSIMPSIDDPSYLQRCLEYLLPMVIAGMTGGHVFGSTRAATLSR